MKLTIGSTCYVTFGRFQPPTTGHGASFDAIANAAREGGHPGHYRIYLSQSNKPVKDNPIPADKKLAIMKKGWPKHASHFYSSPKFNVIPAALEHVMMDHYRNCVYMCGSDRMNEPDMKFVLEHNGVKPKKGHYYNFWSMWMESTGSRDPEGKTFAMSGTKMRIAAQEGDWDFFKKGCPPKLSEVEKKAWMTYLGGLLQGVKL